jgi:hypothetical protein
MSFMSVRVGRIDPEVCVIDEVLERECPQSVSDCLDRDESWNGKGCAMAGRHA